MCLKELKLELNGLTVTPVAALKASKKPSAVTSKDSFPVGQAIVADNDVTLAFDNALPFDIGATNN